MNKIDRNMLKNVLEAVDKYIENLPNTEIRQKYDNDLVLLKILLKIYIINTIDIEKMYNEGYEYEYKCCENGLKGLYDSIQTAKTFDGFNNVEWTLLANFALLLERMQVALPNIASAILAEEKALCSINAMVQNLMNPPTYYGPYGMPSVAQQPIYPIKQQPHYQFILGFPADINPHNTDEEVTKKIIDSNNMLNTTPYDILKSKCLHKYQNNDIAYTIIGPAPDDPGQVRVRCNICGTEWNMNKNATETKDLSNVLY